MVLVTMYLLQSQFSLFYNATHFFSYIVLSQNLLHRSSYIDVLEIQMTSEFVHLFCSYDIVYYYKQQKLSLKMFDFCFQFLGPHCLHRRCRCSHLSHLQEPGEDPDAKPNRHVCELSTTESLQVYIEHLTQFR